MASIFAIFALHSRRIFEKLATQGTSHNAVKLLGDELVAV